jgi:fructoselysine transporter
VKNPAKNIPRAIVLSVLVVAVLYLLMSVVIIGTIPWRDAAVSHAVVSEFIVKLYGSRAASLMTGLILATTLGGIFTMTLGYSRILYAAGAEGNFFRIFGRFILSVISPPFRFWRSGQWPFPCAGFHSSA